MFREPSLPCPSSHIYHVDRIATECRSCASSSRPLRLQAATRARSSAPPRGKRCDDDQRPPGVRGAWGGSQSSPRGPARTDGLSADPAVIDRNSALAPGKVSLQSRRRLPRHDDGEPVTQDFEFDRSGDRDGHPLPSTKQRPGHRSRDAEVVPESLANTCRWVALHGEDVEETFDWRCVGRVTWHVGHDDERRPLAAASAARPGDSEARYGSKRATVATEPEARSASV